MLGKLAKAVAYSKSPRKAYTIFHPIKAAKLGLAYIVGKQLFGRKGKRGEHPAP
ncbi:MAG: hypothetical protein ACRELV_00150 [Longimicrobiales bacterium]